MATRMLLGIKPLIFAACDQGFYEKYGRALERSAAAHGMECIVHCAAGFSEGEEGKARYSVERWLRLPDLLDRHPSVLVLDADSLINETVEMPADIDLGLYLRDTPDIRKKVLGAALYITNRARPFARELRDSLSGKVAWYDDQIALWKLYQKYRDQYSVMRLGPDLINWACMPAPIWSGKGATKFRNPYLKRLKRYA